MHKLFGCETPRKDPCLEKKTIPEDRSLFSSDTKTHQTTNLASTNKHLSAVPEARPKLSTCHCSFSSNKKKDIKKHKLFGCETPTKDPCLKKETRAHDTINMLFGGTTTETKYQANDSSTSNSLSTGITASNMSYGNRLYKFVKRDGSYEYKKYHPSSKCHSSVNLKSAEMHPISTKKTSPEKHTASCKDPLSFLLSIINQANSSGKNHSN